MIFERPTISLQFQVWHLPENLKPSFLNCRILLYYFTKLRNGEKTRPNPFVNIVQKRLNGLKNNSYEHGLIHISGNQKGNNQHGYNTNNPIGNRF